MRVIFIVLLGLLQQPADSNARSLTSLDSLYVAHDTAGLVKALKSFDGDSTNRVQFYRGLAAAWTGRATIAIKLLQPLVDSADTSLTRSDRREAMRALATSYIRTRNPAKATAMYQREVDELDLQADSANARLAAPVDTAPTEPLLDALTSPQTEVPQTKERLNSQVGLIALLVALFIVPKMLQRFRIPGAITSLLMGAAANAMGLFPGDLTLRLFATLGIVSLFLFAGLEIDGEELRRSVKPLVLHAAIWTLLAALTAIVAAALLHIPARPAALIALAIVTPSTGFILSSLKNLGLTASEQKTVRAYAIGSELMALAVLFFVLQSTSARQLALSVAAMVAVVVIIPLAFRAFALLVAPYAPRSEFAFLLMVGVACAYATRLLGVYYLVGAFLVGVAAQRFRGRHPAMSSEKMVDALESFGSVFIPFYFFHAGTAIVRDHISMRAVGIGVVLVAVLVPIRVAVITLHRKIALNEAFREARRVGSAMVPTLVFTLVILGILIDRFEITPALAGGLVLYTIINTTLPAFVLRSQPPDFEDVEALPLERAPAEG